MMHNYDTPAAVEVHQGAQSVAGVIVDPRTVMHTEEMPTDTTWRQVLLPAGGRAQKVLNGDPRRKHTILWGTQVDSSLVNAIMVGSMIDVQGNSGALLMINTTGVQALRFDVADMGELWAKGVLYGVDAGTFTGFEPSEGDVLLNLAVEQWSD